MLFLTQISVLLTAFISCSFAGLHYLYGGSGRPLRLQRPWCGWHFPGRVGRPSVSVWAPVPPAVPSGHVQQWQQRRQPAVPHLQDHLWSEDWQPTTRQDGVSRYPPLAARTPRLQNHPDYLQHTTWHSGTYLAFSKAIKSDKWWLGYAVRVFSTTV